MKKPAVSRRLFVIFKCWVSPKFTTLYGLPEDEEDELELELELSPN